MAEDGTRARPTGADGETIAAYEGRVAQYAAMATTAPEARTLADFIAALAPGASVLDLGCGPGVAAASMQAAGLAVDTLDASPAMVTAARRRGVAARVAGFDDVDAQDAYDGVWASFSLLHAPKAAMPGHLAAIRRALRPGGLLFLALKSGVGERRDRLGRFYAYYDEEELRDMLTAAAFRIVQARSGVARGLAGDDEPWIAVTAYA